MNSNIPHSHIPNTGAGWGKQQIWYWRQFYCHWRILGKPQNKSIILLHGFGASSDHWRNNADFFVNAGFCVYAIDLIGFGKSEQPSPKKIKYLDNKFWAKQLEAFLEEIVQANKSNKAILIGNSLGGLIALTAIALRPDLIESIITAPLPDPALMQAKPSWEAKYIKKIKKFFIKLFFYILPLEIIVPLISRTSIINLALQLAYFRPIFSDNELKKIISKPAKKTTAPRALRSMCLGMSLRESNSTAPELLNQLSNKSPKPSILMIWGKQDKFVPLLLGKRLTKQHPWIKLLVIENSGHCPHDESSNQFNTFVLNWLENNLIKKV